MFTTIEENEAALSALFYGELGISLQDQFSP